VLAIAGYLDGLDFHGVSLALGEHRFSTSEPDHFNRPSPSGFSAELSFSCIHGTGGFGLDVSRRREAFLPLRRVALRPRDIPRAHRRVRAPAAVGAGLRGERR
jgi:hypothetical protein